MYLQTVLRFERIYQPDNKEASEKDQVGRGVSKERKWIIFFHNSRMENYTQEDMRDASRKDSRKTTKKRK